MTAHSRERLDPTVDSRSPTGWRRWLVMLAQYQQARVAEFGLIVVAGFAAAVILLYAFAWLAGEVLDQETLAADMATLTFLQQFSSPWLTAIAQVISLMGSEFLVGVGAVLLVAFLWQQRWGAALSLVLVTAGAQLLNNVLKQAFQRPRPTPLTGLIAAQQFSFPSGHAMVSAAFYLFLAYLSWRLIRGRWPRVLLAGGLILLVLLIGLSRLYLEAHYLSDVIAGYMAGVLWTDTVVIAGRVLTVRTAPRGRPAPP
jgi:undecaprenyl-diphosphatase